MADIVIENLGDLKRQLGAERWWLAIERAAPRAIVPLLVALRQKAPRPQVRRRPGTVRLSDRMQAFVERKDQGLQKAVQVVVHSGVPYGHLVATPGHRIIPRGPTRKGRRLKKAERAILRTGLKVRRAQGAFGIWGRVPGHPYVQEALTQTRPTVVRLLEKLVAQDLQLGVTA